MAHAKLKPITREFLKQFYQKYPLAPVPYETRLAHLQRIEALAAEVTKPGSKVPEQVGMPSPTRIDDCFWRNRMICEELAMSLSKMQDGFSGQPELAATCARCHTLLVSAERSIFAVQDDNTASVKAQLQQFIPQDFRGALLERQRVSTEARYKKQIADLVKRGGTIRQKYDMYLQQQWERRQSLVQLGECSGMYKMVIKWVAGIPQVLLDFAKEINAKLGPMEEQRIKYGPDLYGITELGIRLDVCLAAWAEAAGDATPAARAAAPRLAEVVEPAVAFYCEQMLRVIQHIGNVFQHSPFFVNKDDLDTAAESGLGEEGQGGQGAAAAAPPRPLKQQQGADTECESSTSASASGDYGAAMAAAAAPPPPAKAPAAPPPPPLAPLPLAPSVTAPPTPGLPLEPPLPRASLLLSAAPSDACPEQQQQQQHLLPRFDANGSTNTTTTTAPPPPPLHRVSTPTPHTLAAAVVAGYSGRGTPQSCSRVHLSAMSVESHVSYMSAVDHQPWFLLETEEDAATAGAAAAAAAREVQQHHRRDQGQQHLCHQLQHHQQQQQQGQLQGQQVQGPQAAGAAVADARGCAGLEGEVGGQPRKEKEWERKREEQGGEEEAVQVVVAGAPGPVARGRGRSSPGGCFGGCFGRSGRQSSGGSQQQQQQEKAAQQRGSRGGGSGSATATAAAAAGSSRSAAGHCTLDRGAEHLRAIAE